MINIVVIDSGIDAKHKALNVYNIKSYELIDNNLVEGGIDKYGHGTAITSIICHETTNVTVTMIKLPEVESGVDELKLITVLNYISDNMDVDIINLSLGINTSEHYYALCEVCNKLASKGVIIVSAFDNSGAMSYPAAMHNVIGVTTGRFCKGVKDFEYIEDTIVNIAAKGNIQRVAWTSPEYLLVGGNSFACAHVTAQVAEYMHEGTRTLKGILEKFRESSIYQHSQKENLTKNQMKFSIKKAVLFPFNKEMHSLVRYAKLLPFEIIDIYDTKYSSTVGATTTHLLKDKKIKDFKIKNIECIEWDKFDTLILGHTDELSLLINNTKYEDQLIKQALDRHKQIYSFDDLSILGYDNIDTIFFPKIDYRNLPATRFGMLFKFSKPIVGIFGTSSRQGKFTLQLTIRDILLKQGYNVGQIGTEPSALLYGMDYCFPIGYNSSVYLTEYEKIRYLNHALNDLCLKNKDIILVGSQSGTVTYDMGNLAQYTISQYSFLQGTQPDCVVLCINAYDEYSYISRTINFIESCANCSVIALILFPMTLKDDWSSMYGSRRPLTKAECEEIRNQISSFYNIPVYILGNNEEMYELVEQITDFFV